MKTCSNCSLLSRHVIWIYSPVVSTVSVADGSHVSFFLLAPLTTTYSQFYRYTSKSKFIEFLHWLQHNHLNLAILFKIAKVKVVHFFFEAFALPLDQFQFQSSYHKDDTSYEICKLESSSSFLLSFFPHCNALL